MPTIWEMFGLSGQATIVTGGKLGSQICDGLAEGKVHVVDVSRHLDSCQQKAEETSAQGTEAFARPLDVTSKEAWEQGVRDVMAKLRRIDVLLNNAYSGRLGRL